MDLWEAAEKANIDRIAKLLKKDASSVNGRDDQRRTPLHHAALSGRSDVCKMLLDATAAVDVSDVHGDTPLSLACTKRDIDTVSLLADFGAKISTTDTNGWSPIHVAARYGAEDIAKFLVARGANVDAQTNNGLAALHWCARFGYFDLAKFLLDNGADVNITNQAGWTPLHEAASANQAVVIDMLLEHAADATRLTQDQKLASDLSTDHSIVRKLYELLLLHRDAIIEQQLSERGLFEEHNDQLSKHAQELEAHIAELQAQLDAQPQRGHALATTVQPQQPIAASVQVTATAEVAESTHLRSALSTEQAARIAAESAMQQLRETISEQRTAIEQLTQKISVLTDQHGRANDTVAMEQQRELQLIAENERLTEVAKQADAKILESMRTQLELQTRVTELELLTVPLGDPRVTEFLDQIGLRKYAHLFAKENISYDTLMNFADNDLIRIGLAAFGPRQKLLAEVGIAKAAAEGKYCLTACGLHGVI
eukprot:TRINITY_DN2103_c0_g1_i7.p1 TRINITY_DN2103_c0_g1~~TRINITY_DN2103_c0_g1_i7.p1  ORF type:complete len:484 (-),score=97.48 TRINITY_DN2103_c0_g1_i7:467-1918(-)